jgi:hypothetical protein
MTFAFRDFELIEFSWNRKLVFHLLHHAPEVVSELHDREPGIKVIYFVKLLRAVFRNDLWFAGFRIPLRSFLLREVHKWIHIGILKVHLTPSRVFSEDHDAGEGRPHCHSASLFRGMLILWRLCIWSMINQPHSQQSCTLGSEAWLAFVSIWTGRSEVAIGKTIRFLLLYSQFQCSRHFSEILLSSLALCRTRSVPRVDAALFAFPTSLFVIKFKIIIKE